MRASARAVTYHWTLTTVPHPTSDTGDATVETVLTVAWEPAMSWFRATVHQQVTWIEDGERLHSRDPHAVETIHTARAARFNALRMNEVAVAALHRLSAVTDRWFDATTAHTQPTLLAA